MFTYLSKGLTNKKISNQLLWGGRLARHTDWALMLPTPQYWIIYFLEFPKLQIMNAIALILFAIAEMALFVAIARLEKSRAIAPIN